MLTVSPFFHRNSANYLSSPADVPVSATQDRTSTYAGGQASFSANLAKNNLQTGVYTFYQQNHEQFGAIFNDGSGNPPFNDVENPTGSLTAFFVDDKFKPVSWLTLSAGMRPTHFSGARGFSENAISPRFGAATCRRIWSRSLEHTRNGNSRNPCPSPTLVTRTTSRPWVVSGILKRSPANGWAPAGDFGIR
jgi:hypothetical protein